MNRFDNIINHFVLWGNSSDQLLAAFIIGSQTRADHPADNFSDLDIVMIVDNPDALLHSDHWIEQIGKSHISFIEDTIGGGKERRILFDHALDVDFIILTKNNFDNAIAGSEIAILKRGYLFLIDKISIGTMLPPIAADKLHYLPLTESDFNNLTNDFWYHAVWTAKKLIRGELWTAKSCVDSYMKSLLLTLIECHAHILHGMEYDTWHNGRFLEEWAEDWVIQKLSSCYAYYDRESVKHALVSTMDLFRLISIEIAGRLNYEYPANADTYSTDWITKTL